MMSYHHLNQSLKRQSQETKERGSIGSTGMMGFSLESMDLFDPLDLLVLSGRKKYIYTVRAESKATLKKTCREQIQGCFKTCL